jgi:soluble lytic murein transglycosylase-like protein
MKWLFCFMLLLGTASAETINPCRRCERAVEWVECYAGAYHVPVELVEAIIDEESGWNPNAVSTKGAAGIMQLMPQTAMRFGVHNRFRLEENIRGGVAYLAWLTQRLGSDLRLVTAAYYVGEHAINMRRLAYSSADVQRYVRRVARRYQARRLPVSRALSLSSREIEVTAR